MAPIQNVAPKINKSAPKINEMAPIQNVAPKIDKVAPKIKKWHQFNVCLSAAQHSQAQPITALYRPAQ